MPSGYEQGKKTGDFSNRGRSFIQWPKGLRRFKLKNDGDIAIVRFAQQHEEINWVRQWKTEVKPGHPYGEKLNCVDQYEDGTPDPGFELGLKTAWTAYAPLIQRNAEQFQRDSQGRMVKDGNGNFVLSGYEDTMVVWEMPFGVYEILRSVEADYKGLMSRDFKVKRIGAAGSTKTTYALVPEPIDGGPTPVSPQDQALMRTQAIDIASLVRVPSYEELATYLNGGEAIAAPVQQSIPIQHQQVPPIHQSAPANWPAQPPVPAAVPAAPTEENPFLAGNQ